MTLFGNRVFGDGIKMMSYQIRAGPKSSDRCPHEKSRGYTEIHREKGRVKMDAEIGMMLP